MECTEFGRLGSKWSPPVGQTGCSCFSGGCARRRTGKAAVQNKGGILDLYGLSMVEDDEFGDLFV